MKQSQKVQRNLGETRIKGASEVSYPLLKLGLSTRVIKHICLVLLSFYAVFYFYYIGYSDLLIFCCQNVATHLFLSLMHRFNRDIISQLLIKHNML